MQAQRGESQESAAEMRWNLSWPFSFLLLLFVCAGNDDVQSLLHSASPLLFRFARVYSDSLRCLLSSVWSLPLESLLPVIASVVLHLFVPLLFLRFDESRAALGWFAVEFALAHAIYHFTPISSGEAVRVARIVAILPMTFELWMSAGQGRRRKWRR